MNLTRLARTLAEIERYDLDYPIRYGLVLRALTQAHDAGLTAGIGWDEDGLPGFRVVVYIELPTGQTSWHLPEHPHEWDKHDTETKYGRCRALAAA